MAEIRWYGHNCFRIRGKDAVVLTDPVGRETGFSLARTTADIVTISSESPDHANLNAVKPEFDTVRGPGEYEMHDVFITGIRTHLDEAKGKERGHNTVYLIELDGMKFCHLGDLGHSLGEEDIAAIGDVDVLLTPAGSASLDPARAAEITSQLSPKVVIPMQFATGSGDRALANLETYCRNLGVSVPEPTDKLSLKASDLGETMQVVALSVS
ncbi:MAG: MBL fold metallo-hydrolase [Thermomicrobiales bacterium]